MQKILDWIDESASSLIRLAYLVAGITAVATYFASGIVSNDATQVLNASLPWVLAAAVEIHTYLSARRVRGHFQQLQTSTDGTPAHEQALRGLKVNLGILAGLLAFSVYNQMEYLAATWTPPHTALSLPDPIAFVLRAMVTPAAFMGAAFLAPMGASLAAQVRAEAHRVAGETFKVARAQWKQRLGEMKAKREDVTAALVQLVDDPDERRVIATIHAAMYDGTYPMLPAGSTDNWLPLNRTPDGWQPPNGGGSPVAGSEGGPHPLHDSAREAISNGQVVHLPPKVTRRVVASRRGRSARYARTVDNYEQQARAAFASGARTRDKMVAATGMGATAAASWVRTLKAEARASSQPLGEQQREQVAL